MTGKLFYLIYILFGLFFVFVIPPFQKPDEIVFFYKSVAVSRGDLTCQESPVGPSHQIPKYLFDLPETLLTSYLVKHPDSPIPVDQYRLLLSAKSFDSSIVFDTSACPLNPFLFVIPGLFISLPVMFDLNPLLIFYLGRLSVFLVFLLITSLSIRLIPRKFLSVLYFVLLLPMTLNQVTAFNKDVWHLSFGFLTFSLYLRSILSSQSISLREYCLFVVALSITIISRWQYLPLIFLLLTVRFTPWRRHNKLLVISLIGLFLGCLTISILIAFHHLDNLASYPYLPFVYPQEQLLYLSRNPLDIVRIIINSFVVNGDYYLRSLFGILGWLDVELNPFIYYSFFAIFGIIIYKLSQKINLSRSATITFAFIILFIIGLDLFSFYIFWTPVGASSVAGIQGRYFLGLLPYLTITLASIVKIIGRQKLMVLLLVCLGFSFTVSIYNRYYGFSTNYMVADDQAVEVSMLINKPSSLSMPVESKRKIIGFQAALDNSPNYTVAYITVLKSSDCSTVISQKIVSANQVNNQSNFNFIFNNFVSRQKSVCLEIAPLFDAPYNTPLHITKLTPIYRI